MSPELFRSVHFPQLTHRSYLATCSLSPYAPMFADAGKRMLDAMQTNRLAWPAFEDEVRGLRCRIARQIGAETSQIALLPNASIGAYQIASTANWTRRPNIVYSSLEFPSISHIWLAQGARGARAVLVDSSGSEERTLSSFARVIDSDTRLVSVPLVGYVDGKRLPVKSLAVLAKQRGARIFVDAYQGVGAVRVDVNDLGCDYLVGGFMKYLLGLPGLAFLYVRDPTNTDLDPQLTGWFGRRRPFDFDPMNLDYSDSACRFEIGTPSISAVYAANAGLATVTAIDSDIRETHVNALVTYAAARLRDDGEQLLHIPGDGEHGAHIAIRTTTPDTLTGYLQHHGVMVSPRGNAIRLAFHYFNVREDVDRLCNILQSFRTTLVA